MPERVYYPWKVAYHTLTSEIRNPFSAFAPPLARNRWWVHERRFAAGSRWEVVRYREARPARTTIAVYLYPYSRHHFSHHVYGNPIPWGWMWQEVVAGDTVQVTYADEDALTSRSPGARRRAAAMVSLARQFHGGLSVEPLRSFDTVMRLAGSQAGEILHAMFLHGAVGLDQIEAFDAIACRQRAG